jgi:hypothetical protein
MARAENQILEDAATLLGHADLAKGLAVSETELDKWLTGQSEMPVGKFKALSALLVAFAQRT